MSTRGRSKPANPDPPQRGTSQRSAFRQNTFRTAAEAAAALRGQPRIAVRASSPEAPRRQETCILPDDVQPGLHPLVLPAGSSHGSPGQGQRQGAHGVRRGAATRVLPPGAEEIPGGSGRGRSALQIQVNRGEVQVSQDSRTHSRAPTQRRP